MAKSALRATALLRAALLATTAVALTAPAAVARVGVTSATDGDPLGKPPAEAERVLRIGIDVQANEVIRTGANDRAHLVFLDGTALTVGPNAQLTIDKFVYDPSTKTGELAVNASKGVLRLVGGKISKTRPITITTPSSTIGIRGGICVLDVQPNSTTSTFLFGNNMTVTGNGGTGTQNVTRPGSQVTTAAGAPPSQPTLVGQGALTGQMSQLEGSTGGGGGSAGQQGGQQGGQQQGGPAPNSQNTDRPVAGNGQPPGGPNGPGQPGGSQPPTNQDRNPLANGQGAKDTQGPTTVTTTTQTKVVVSKNTLGRYLADPTYTGFNNTNLGVSPNAANNKTLPSTGSVETTTTTTTRTTSANGTSNSSSTSTNSSTLTLVLPGTGTGTGSITLPWQTDTIGTDGFTVPDMTALGQTLTNGKGYVSKNGEFFAYIFSNNGDKVGLFGGTTTTPTGTTNFPTSGVAAYTLAKIGDGALPFAGGAVSDDAAIRNAAVVSKLYSAYSTTLTQTYGLPPPDARATALQAAISISGTGAGQKSYMGVFIGTYFRDINVNTDGTVTSDNGVALSGAYNGTYRLGGNQKIGRQVSAESTPLTPNGNAIYGTPSGDGAAAGMMLTPDRLSSTASISGGNVSEVTTVRTPQASFDQPYDNLPGSSYFNVTAANKVATPSGVGTTRTTQTMNGFVGGIVDSVDSSNNYSSRTVTTTDPTAMTLSTDATNNRASVELNVDKWDAQTTTSASFKLGATSGGNGAVSAFIDDKNYAVRDRGTEAGTPTSVGGLTSNVTSTTTMVSYNVAPAADFFAASGVTPCTCEFMTWGWWGGDMSYANTGTYNPGGRDRINLATYVAGNLSVASDINALTSTATYNGHMVGNVNNNGSSYIAAGSYQNVWNFGSRSGAVTATFDGTTFGNGSTNTYMTGASTPNFGTLSAQGGTSAPIVAGGRSLTLNGAFMSGGAGNPVAGQAGSFAVTGTNYQAGGTFAAQK
ncbi:MAG: FecR domain-containing protein [Proteobacteria bacterium]|nr:FecR domain-containing protein [Pseudomonadota bacterium]